MLRLRSRWRPLSLVFASEVDAAAVAVRLTAARKAWQAAAPPERLARLDDHVRVTASARATIAEAASHDDHATLDRTRSELVARVTDSALDRAHADECIGDWRAGSDP